MRTWLVLATALALLGQSIVVQTHSHLPLLSRPLQAPLAGTAAAQGASTGTPLDDSSTCPVCRQLAQNGHYTSPGAVALPVPLRSSIERLSMVFLVWPTRHVPHGWQGRAPPAALQIP